MNERARREVLAGAGLDVLGALREQRLVGVALDVGAGRRPVLLVDEVDDEALELGGVLDPVLRLAEDDAEDAGLPGEVLEDVPVGQLQIVARSEDRSVGKACRSRGSPYPYQK